jgi:hypothetical protein
MVPSMGVHDSGRRSLLGRMTSTVTSWYFRNLVLSSRSRNGTGCSRIQHGGSSSDMAATHIDSRNASVSTGAALTRIITRIVVVMAMLRVRAR